MKKILIALFVVTAAISITPRAAFANTRAHHAARVTFWLPDSWNVNGDDSQLTASEPSGEAALLFVLKDHRDMKAAIAAIDETVAQLATDVKAGAAKKVEINGMEGVVVDATGRTQGRPVELSVLILHTPANRYLMIFGALDSAHKHAHDGELRRVIESIKPAQ